MNQNTINNPKRFRRHRTSAVPSLQSKCYFHIKKTSERPKTLKLKFKIPQTNFLITANSAQNELLPRFFPNSIPKHSAVRHSEVDSHFSWHSVVKQSNRLDTFSEYRLKFVDRFLTTVADVNDTSSPGRNPSTALQAGCIVSVDKMPKRNPPFVMKRSPDDSSWISRWPTLTVSTD